MLTGHVEPVFAGEVSRSILVSSWPDGHALVPYCRVVDPVPVGPDIPTWLRVKKAVGQIPSVLITKLLGLSEPSPVVAEVDIPLGYLLAVVDAPAAHPVIRLLTAHPPSSAIVYCLSGAGEVVVVVLAGRSQGDCPRRRGGGQGKCVCLLARHVELVVARKASCSVLGAPGSDSHALVVFLWVV